MAPASGPGKGAGSSEALPGGSTTTEHALGPKQSVSYGVWNVRGFVQRDYCRLRENVITATDLDIVCLCETFLRNSEIISIEGYKWFGHNRTNISKRAVRGSGGVGVLVKESMFDRFSIDVVDKRHEDILWLACTQINNPDNTIFIGVCYLPPAASSRGDKSHDVFDTLRCQCLKFQDKGEILICGDFNARIGSLNDMSDVTQTRLPQRQIIDYTTNSHGK
ncbi:MAG: endonuclease/exonuclease/phosphatase family protein, partial [Alphaproteobacteria bacterium]|nr:endonuclease/exonuclease/phosphatase family protein [Alphaproteobacteria bacterium]